MLTSPTFLLLLQLHQMPEQPEIWTSSTLHKRDTKVKRKDWPLWRMWKQLLVNFLFGVFTTIDSDMFDPDTARRERCEITPTLEESFTDTSSTCTSWRWYVWPWRCSLWKVSDALWATPGWPQAAKLRNYPQMRIIPKLSRIRNYPQIIFGLLERRRERMRSYWFSVMKSSLFLVSNHYLLLLGGASTRKWFDIE